MFKVNSPDCKILVTNSIFKILLMQIKQNNYSLNLQPLIFEIKTLSCVPSYSLFTRTPWKYSRTGHILIPIFFFIFNNTEEYLLNV